MQDLLSFKKMITPGFIHVIYWIGILAVLLNAIGGVIGGAGIVSRVVMAVAGLIIVRVGCEVLLVLFRINENLAALRNSKGI